MKSFKVMVHGCGDPAGHLTSNALRFATREQAESYGRDLSARWMGMDAWEVQESEDEVNR